MFPGRRHSEDIPDIPDNSDCGKGNSNAYS